MAHINRAQKVPAQPWILKQAPAGDPPQDKTQYLSIVMSLMFLARLTRADILFACVYLATFTSAPTRSHYLHACRLLRYVSDSPNYGVLFRRQAGQARMRIRSCAECTATGPRARTHRDMDNAAYS